MLAFWYLLFREFAHLPADKFSSDISLALRAGALGLFVADSSVALKNVKYS